MVAPAAVMGGLSMGMSIIGSIISGVRDRKERERQAAEQAKAQQQQQEVAAAGRFDQDSGGGAGPTAGLNLRPQLGDLGLGMGTLQTTMMPGMQSQEQNMFQPAGINYGQQQPQQPQGQPQDMGAQGELTPNSAGGGPPQAPSFNLLGSIMNQNRGPYGR